MPPASLPPRFEENAPAAVQGDEIQDLTMSSDGEINGACQLPPRLAARFHRTSSTRRKSSAASSRRNSITSNRSSRSCHGGGQSTHIAQHLRRASIIESRKARLADRAAHAEQVRLRAALVKAAPRTNSAREDRAMAAHQARERYLAQVAASCAEEVKRVKKVAEETKEKKAAEHLKLRLDMEDRLADAEKRRLLYQRNLRRNRSNLASVEERKVLLQTWKPKSREAAARLIQKAWRNRLRRTTVSSFLALHLTLEHVQKTSFEEVSTLLASEDVLHKTAKFLKLVGLQDSETTDTGENAAVRHFLSAFLILGHPEQVLSQDGEQEQDLVVKARDLLMHYGRILAKLPIESTFSPSSELIASLAEAFTSFHTAFTAWKNHDSSILVETMILQFVELDAIWQTVKNDTDGHVADDYKEGIRYNQTLVLARLKRLAGAERALQLVTDAVRASRKTRMKNKPKGDAKPRAAPARAPTPVDAVVPPVPATQEDPSSSDRVLQTTEFNRLTNPMPENRVIIHELAIDKTYRVDFDHTSAARQAISRAVFNSMRSDIEAGLGDQWILCMAESIRKTLLRLVTPGKSMHNLITENLDTKLIENQLSVGSFSYAKFFSFMNMLLPKLCAPIRDRDVKALADDTSSDFIERLAKLMRVIELLSLDYANHILQVSAPDLISHAAEYEQRCFADQFGNRKLVRTIRWWSRARAKAVLEASRRAPAAGSASSSLNTVPSAQRIYAIALVDLFIALPPLLESDVPETLLLDRHRIERARAAVLRMLVVATILTTAKSLMKRDVRTPWPAVALSLHAIGSAGDDDGTPATAAAYQVDALPAYMAVLDLAHTLPPTARATLQNTVTRVLEDARRAPAPPSHPVLRLLLQKLRAHTLAHLAAASAEERLRVEAGAREQLAGGGLVEAAERVRNLVDLLRRVRGVDSAAHSAALDAVRDAVEAEARARPRPVEDAASS